MTDLEAKFKDKRRGELGVPKITGAYASLINSDLHDDLLIPGSGSVNNPIVAA